jgi:ABC-type microcin C transport system duplicated ATPase subunit YejF
VSEPLLEIEHLTVAFPILGGIFRRKVAEVRAVDDVSFTIVQGETVGLVGESGCGKTTVAKAIVNIHKAMSPGVREEGKMLFHTPEGTVDLLSLSAAEMRPHRAQIQMIFQDPFSSLNPRMTVGQIIDAPLRIHTAQTAEARRRSSCWRGTSPPPAR